MRDLPGKVRGYVMAWLLTRNLPWRVRVAALRSKPYRINALIILETVRLQIATAGVSQQVAIGEAEARLINTAIIERSNLRSLHS